MVTRRQLLDEIELLNEISRAYGRDAESAAQKVLNLAKQGGNGVSLRPHANCVTLRVKPPSFRNPVAIAWLNLPRESANYGGTGFDAAFGADTYTRTDAKPPPDHVRLILRNWEAECRDLPSVQLVPQNKWATTYAMSYAKLARTDHLKVVLAALEGVIVRIRN